MRRSLKKKWTAFMMLLVLAVLSIVGVFMLSATVNYYSNQFRSQVGAVFTTNLLSEMNSAADSPQETAVAQISNTLDAYRGTLGIGAGREYYVIDGESGVCLSTSETAFEGSLKLSSNMVAAMNGQVGEDIALFGRQMDLAVPVTNGDGGTAYVVAVRDDRSETRHVCWLMFMVILASLIIGLAASAALSLVLIRTVTDPIASLSRGAARIAAGEDVEPLPVYDPDELGELTESFNEMAQSLRRTRTVARLEHARMDLIGGYLSEGLLTISAEGEITKMNAAAETLLGVAFAQGLRFADVFPSLPFPDAAGGAVQLIFRAGDRDVRAVFVADENHGFNAVIAPAEETA